MIRSFYIKSIETKMIKEMTEGCGKMNGFIKRLLSVSFALSITISLMSVFPAYSANTLTSDGMSFALREGTDNELILTSYTGNAASLTVPEIADGKSVTAINDGVFSEIDTLTTVILPDSIEWFGADVFRDSSVQSVNIPKSLRVIPSYTFYNCQELEKVDFHDDIAVIANTAFKKTGVTVPEDLKERVTGNSIYSSDIVCQFSSANWSYSIISQDGDVYAEIRRYIGSERDITIPSKLNSADVTVCGKNTFPDMNNISSVTFPETISSLVMSFAESSIEEISAPGISTIPVSEFENCSMLRKAVFTNTAEELQIGAKAFSGCTALESFDIPDICKNASIGNYAFENSGIRQLQISCPSVIGQNAFAECSSLINVELNDAMVSSRAFMDCTQLKEMTFHGNVTLDDLCVYCCSSLENLNLTDCELVSDTSFHICPKLNSINSSPVFNSVTGDFVPEMKELVMKYFRGADDVGFINEYVLARVKEVVDENIKENMTDIEKVRILHDWVCANTKYTDGLLGERNNHTDSSIFLNDSTVCDGYARICNLLYHAAGLESCYVSGANHAWNIVKICGEYFHIDTTWDDSGTVPNKEWFMRSDEEIRNAGGCHSKWQIKTPSELHSFQSEILPECQYSMGDVNSDGSINVADLVSMEYFLLGSKETDIDKWILADMTYDGRIDTFDLVMLRYYIQ